MKRLLCLLLSLTLLLSVVPAFAASLLSGVDVQLKMRLSTRSGPGTDYTELGSYFAKGDWLTAISRAYDESNGIWWIQVEFEYQKEKYRAYTGHKRLDMSLTEVPEEGSLGWYTVASDAYAWNGPGPDYNMLSLMVPGGTSGEVIAQEYGYVQFEYYDADRGLSRRVWLWAGDVYGFDASGWNDGWYDADQPQQWTSPAINNAVYARGDTHMIVLWVQAQLKTLGYYTSATADLTGYLDSTTEYAIRQFQQASGLSVTGYVTQTLVDTLLLRQRWSNVTQYPVYVGGWYGVLDGMYETPLSPGDVRGRETRTLQMMLDALGYSVGSIDGAFGNKTLTAFNRWQADYGFAPTAAVTLGHMRALLDAYLQSGGSVDDLPER